MKNRVFVDNFLEGNWVIGNLKLLFLRKINCSIWVVSLILLEVFFVKKR